MAHVWQFFLNVCGKPMFDVYQVLWKSFAIVGLEIYVCIIFDKYLENLFGFYLTKSCSSIISHPCHKWLQNIRWTKCLPNIIHQNMVCNKHFKSLGQLFMRKHQNLSKILVANISQTYSNYACGWPWLRWS